MTQFIQLHYLTFYPPSNPNRDEQGRPKTCIVGGVDRLRISSQSVKRAVRTSEAFRDALQGHLGRRTARIGDALVERLLGNGHDQASAMAHARAIAGVFGKIGAEASEDAVAGEADADGAATEADNAAAKPAKGGKGKKGAAKGAREPAAKPTSARIATLAYIADDEWDRAMALADAAVPGSEPRKVKADEILSRTSPSVDVALFGRMFADPAAFEYRRDAACQVSHAFTTSACKVDFDYYTAMDDLANREAEGGAGFLDTAYHGSGVYYQYVCVSVDQLRANLGDGSGDLAGRALEALVEGFATVGPSGKKNSFAHNTRAAYVLAEVGTGQPRSLAQAFVRPVSGGDLMERSIEALLAHRDRIDTGYGDGPEGRMQFDVYRELTPADRAALPAAERLSELTAFCAATASGAAR